MEEIGTIVVSLLEDRGTRKCRINFVSKNRVVFIKPVGGVGVNPKEVL